MRHRARQPERAGVAVTHRIVAYCRGRYCLMSVQAVRLLRTRGYYARPLAGGVAEWRADGHPTATSVA
jgi:rhodanese-related sulfurtransferase